MSAPSSHTALTRPYQYYDFTLSLCPTCMRRVEAKVVFEHEKVWLLKRCPEHGPQRVMIADDIEYYRSCRETFIKPSEMPQRFNTPVERGCPLDCGLCTDHEQHSCLTLIEITQRCNLECPVCYAESGPHVGAHVPLARVQAMLDAIVENEGEPDVVQISGGEPTIHPDFFAILDAARQRPIRHLMVNTNGVRIARDAEFARRLAEYMPGFELYLQFDSLQNSALRSLRGADLAQTRRQALERLNELGISTTLVVTVKAGLNDHELGDIIEFAITQPCVRGVTFQPVQDAGRVEDYDGELHRTTLTQVRRKLLEQSPHFQAADIIPVPCHPDAIAMGYALRSGGKLQALTHLVPQELLLNGTRNTISFERPENWDTEFCRSFSTAHSPSSAASSLHSLLCCLPEVQLPEDMNAGIGYRDLFRIIIMEFMDAENFDVRSVKKSCVHIVHPEDLRIIPFETYNLFYRPGLTGPGPDALRQRAPI